MISKAIATVGIWAAWASVPIVAMITYDKTAEVVLGVVIYGVMVGFCVTLLTAELWK